MTTRKPRFEAVRSHSGWHARFIAANGRTVVSSEVYTKRAHAFHAIELLTGFAPKRYGGDWEVQVWQFVHPDVLLEVRVVDERGA